MIVYSSEVEADYVHWLKKALDHAEIPLESVPQDTIPLERVRAAKKLKDAARKDGNAYDTVWCLVDDSEGVDQARLLAARQRIRLIVSRPCFLVWLLLHFEDVESGIVPSDVVARLAPHLPELFVPGSGKFDRIAGRYLEARNRVQGASDLPELVEYLRQSLQEYLGDEFPRLV